MMLKNRLLTAENFKTSSWTGGKTTELYIHPLGSNLKDRNFDIRLSTATVEIERSIFTKLPSVSRTLIVLDGEMKLEHQNQHTKILDKFKFDRFDGGWNTISYGTCIDFNIMTTNRRASKVTPLLLVERDQIVLQSCIEAEASFLYVYKGVVSLSGKNEKYDLRDNNHFVLYKCDVLNIKAQENSEILLIEIFE